MIKKIPTRRTALFTIPPLFAAYFGSGCLKPSTTMPKITYPQTKRGDVIEKISGCAIADPYRRSRSLCWTRESRNRISP